MLLMKALIAPDLLQQLARKKLRVRRAVAALGIGERRSKAKGAGLEFAEHRPYQFGDDIRYLDPHLEARLGQQYIKQFTLYQQLSVTILLDSSLSMGAKFDFARSLVAALAYVALAGGDRVLLGSFANGVVWSPQFRGIYRTTEAFTWLQHQKTQGATQMAPLLAQTAPRLRRGGLLLVVSDWLSEESLSAIKAFQNMGQELVVMQVLAPEELEPDLLGTGGLRLGDVESGEETELNLEEGLFQRYRELLSDWCAEIKTQVQSQQGLYFRLRSDEKLDRLFARDFQNGGLLG